MMLVREGLLLLMGICAGSMIAAGVFAFIAVIGLVPRLAGRTHTARHMDLYENVIVAGGVTGNLLSLYGGGWYWRLGGWGGGIFAAVIGVAAGVFVGSLVMSLAETLDAVPVLIRRFGLKVGTAWLVTALALGKLIGSLVYFWTGFAG